MRQKFHQLICPIDAYPLYYTDTLTKQLSCETGHCFDIAKQGYVNLLPVQNKKSLSPGDSKAMVEARSRFLESELYLPVLNKLMDIIDALALPAGARILDAGCGEGYYTKQLAEKFKQFQFVGLDISKDALKFASHKSENIDWVVSSNSHPPLASNSIDLIICIFGFPNFVGFSRVLKNQHQVVLVDPAEEHLLELREQAYEQVKKRPVYSLEEAELEEFTLLNEQILNFKPATLQQKQIQDLLLMTPHLFRASTAGKVKVKDLEQLEITVDMCFRTLSLNTCE